MKSRKLPDLDGTQQKEFLAKCLMETVNRFIFQIVREQIKLQDQSYSVQPGLVAHPVTVLQMPDGRLDQISSSQFGHLMKEGFF
jgi:hypothetical protein